jgi:hypothetical protein
VYGLSCLVVLTQSGLLCRRREGRHKQRLIGSAESSRLSLSLIYSSCLLLPCLVLLVLFCLSLFLPFTLPSSFVFVLSYCLYLSRQPRIATSYFIQCPDKVVSCLSLVLFCVVCLPLVLAVCLTGTSAACCYDTLNSTR